MGVEDTFRNRKVVVTERCVADTRVVAFKTRKIALRVAEKHCHALLTGSDGILRGPGARGRTSDQGGHVEDGVNILGRWGCWRVKGGSLPQRYAMLEGGATC